MGRAPCCSKVGLHRGPWTPREDTLLVKYIQTHGEGHWRSLPKKAGLLRCGKSCRLRWMNYLRPDIKRGNISPDEDDLIIRLHGLLGNRWSLIAGRLPGRTDNEIKNYWNTHLSKRLLSQGTDPITHKKLPNPPSSTPTPKNNNKKRNNNNTKKQIMVIKSSNNINNNNKKNKRKKSSSSSKGTVVVEPEKPKVHLPKPIRIRVPSSSSFSSLPRNDSFDQCNTLSTVSSSQGGGGEDIVVQQQLLPWSSSSDIDELNQNGNAAAAAAAGSFLAAYDDDDDHDFVGAGSDFDCHASHHHHHHHHHHVLAAASVDGTDEDDDNNSLEKLYEEYLQLLKANDEQVQLDSFAESLLA